MRIILDCNVIIRASLSPHSIASKAVRLAEEKHTLLASVATLEEFSRTILKEKFDRYFKPIDTRLEVISRYTNRVEWIVPSHSVKKCRDPKDDIYLELALSGNEDRIVTNDEDLLVLHPFEHIPIIILKEFLERF